ncbi:MAG: hypothetical protein KAT68_12185 [Bacteroidales bacterium]|nr:hypothetical protein [Bacteroidales bacterium]
MIKYILIFISGFIIGAGIMFYIFNKPHKDVKTLKPDFVINAIDLFTEYEEDEELSNNKFLNKVIEVKGQIISKSKVSIIIGDDFASVNCVLNKSEIHKIKNINISSQITIRGICSGMGLIDVGLTKCIIVE